MPTTEYGTEVTVHEGNLPGLMVIMSGTHGVEGHGSKLVQDEIEKNFIPDSAPTLFVVRKVNAWGYENNERFTKDGRDLNRAGMHSPPKNEYYAMVKDVVNKKHESVRSLETALALEALQHPYLLAKGTLKAGGPVKAMTHAIMSGQYQDPSGFEYRGPNGGVAKELVALGKLLRNLQAKYVPQPKPLIVWDLHTGVGEPGSGDMLICDTDQQRQLLLAALPPDGDSAKRIRQGGKSVYGVQGSAMGGIYRILKGIGDEVEPQSPDVVVTQEFATRPEKETLWALVNKKAGGSIDLLPQFYVQDGKWPLATRARGLQLYRELSAYCASLARPPLRL